VLGEFIKIQISFFRFHTIVEFGKISVDGRIVKGGQSDMPNYPCQDVVDTPGYNPGCSCSYCSPLEAASLRSKLAKSKLALTKVQQAIARRGESQKQDLKFFPSM
jgi:hypothetical protein